MKLSYILDSLNDRKLDNTVKLSRFKHLGDFHKEWTEAGVVHQESPRSDIFRKRATKPHLKHRQKHLTWAKEKNTRGIPNYCFKCENIAEVAPTLKNNGLVIKGSWNHQVFALNFYLVMSEFLLEKEQDK